MPRPLITTCPASSLPKGRHPKQPAGSQLFGLQAIAAFLGLDQAETLRRLESGEIPCQFTSARQMPIADRAVLDAIRRSPHFQRQG